MISNWSFSDTLTVVNTKTHAHDLMISNWSFSDTLTVVNTKTHTHDQQLVILWHPNRREH